MKQDRINAIINESINEVLSERNYNLITKVLRENLQKYMVNEDNHDKKNFVLTSCRKLGVKQSELAYKLWPDMDKDEARSLFSRKLKDEEWHFDDYEINKLYQLIRSI